MHLNHFLMVDAPTDDAITLLKKSFDVYNALNESVQTGWKPFDLPENEEIDRVVHLMNAHQELPLIERATMLLTNFEERVEVDEIPSDFFQEVAETQTEEETNDRMNIFIGLRMTEYLKPLEVPDDPAYRAAILNRKSVRDQVEYIQRLCGKSGRQSTNIAMELVGDMDRGTDYPPAPLDPPVLAPQITAKLREIIDAISLKKKEAAEKPE